MKLEDAAWTLIQDCILTVDDPIVYWLYIDDQSFDVNTPDRHPPPGFIAATSSAQAIHLIKLLGPPSVIDFDHDLGELPNTAIYITDDNENEWSYPAFDTAKEVCKFLADPSKEPGPYFNADIEVRIHSANGEGAAWIKSWKESWDKARGK